MVVNRWRLGVFVGIVVLLGFVGFSPAQKTPMSETMLWDTAVLDTGTNSFNEGRLRLLSDGWEPFATSDEGSGIYRLHFRKRVPLAIVQKQLADQRAQKSAEKSIEDSRIIADAGYKRVTGGAATEALKPFLGEWEYDRADSELKADGVLSFIVKQSGDSAMFSSAGEKDALSDVNMDRSGQIVLIDPGDAADTFRIRNATLVEHTQLGDLVFIHKSG